MSKKAGVDKETRRVALLLSGLITTPKEELEDYRKKRLGRGSAVPLDHLARARAVLIAVAEALQSDDDDDIAALEELHRRVLAKRPADDAPADDPPEPIDPKPIDPEPEDPADEAPPTTDEPADDVPDDTDATDDANDPVPRPPRIGEGPIDSAPALAPSETASPWANPMAALAASRPSPPKASRPPVPPAAPSPLPVPPPPLVAPAPAGDTDIADDDPDEESHTERPTSSSPPSDPPTRHPRAGDTAAPPASVTAEAGAEIPASPALPFVGLPNAPTDPNGTRPTTGGPWALPFASSPPEPEPDDEPVPPRFPRAEPDDDEPTMASIARGPGDRHASDEARSLQRDDDDLDKARDAALAHTKIPDSALSLTDYAALCAICGAFPAHLSDTYLRFGLRDHAERYALDEIWHAHFAQRPEAQILYKALFNQFRSWLTQYGRL